MVTLNENLKLSIRPEHSKHKFLIYLLCSSISGCIAGYLTTCLDTIKTHLQTTKYKRIAKCHKQCKILTCDDVIKRTNTTVLLKRIVINIWKQGGIKGFYRGATARSLISGISCSLAWVTYEAIKFFLINK